MTPAQSKKPPPSKKKHPQSKNLLTLSSPVATPHCLTKWSWHHPILLPGVLRVARSIGILVRRWGPSDNHRGWFRINGRDTPLAFAGLSSSSRELIASPIPGPGHMDVLSKEQAWSESDQVQSSRSGEILLLVCNWIFSFFLWEFYLKLIS